MSLGSSLAITLPKSWINTNMLEKGNSVSYTIQNDQSLLLVAGKVKKRNPELTLLIEEDQTLDTTIRGIIAGFLNGYTIIKLRSKIYLSPDQQRLIRSVTQRLYMMIVKSDSYSVTLQTIIDESNTPLISSVERMYMITAAMCNDVLLCIKTPNVRLLESTIALEDDVDQLKLLISRLIRVSVKDPAIASSQSLDALDCLDYQILVNHIERVTYYLSNIASNLLLMQNSGYHMPDNVLPIYITATEKAVNNYNRAVKSFFSKDVEFTNEIIDDEYKIIDMFDKVIPLPDHLSDKEKDIIVNLIHIRESVNKISHYAAAIAETTIDQTYKES